MEAESTSRWSFSHWRRPQAQKDVLFRTVEQSIRRNSKTFYFATAFLPATKRRAIRTLYAFCRATDDLVDVHKATHQEVEAWRKALQLPCEQQANPVLHTWAVIRSEYGINPQYEEELIRGVEYDIQPRQYTTWKELETYCYHVASTVGLLSIPIIGLRKGTNFAQAAPYAIKLGVALQLTNILRDVGEDASHGRVYLPEEDLERFGLTRAEVLGGVHDQRFDGLMAFEIERACRLYHEALPGIALLHPSGRLAVGVAALLYRAILDEIETLNYRVHWMRAHTSGRKKLAMLPGILVRILNQRPPTQAPPHLWNATD